MSHSTSTWCTTCLYDPALDTAGNDNATRLVRTLFAPTPGSKEDPGITVYRERLEYMDDPALAKEASSFAYHMHDTGLASPYHAVFMRYLRKHGRPFMAWR